MGTHRPDRDDEGRPYPPVARPPSPASPSVQPPVPPPVPVPGHEPPRVVWSPQSGGWAPAPPGWAAPPPPPPDDGSVVPLRPFGLAEIWRGTFRAIGEARAATAAALLLAFAVAAGIGIAAGPTGKVTRVDGFFDTHRYYDVHIAHGASVVAGFARLGELAAALVVPAVLCLVAGRRGHVEPGSAGRAAVAALVPAIAFVPSAVLAAVTLGHGSGWTLLNLPLEVVELWVAVGTGLAPAVAAAEGLGPVAAVVRSWRLVRGSWWRSFGIFLVLDAVGVVSAIGSFVYGAALVGSLSSGQTATLGGTTFVVVTALAGAVGAVMTAIGRTLLYVDLRSRTETLAWSLDAARKGDGRPVLGPGGVYDVRPAAAPPGGPSAW